MGYTDPVIPQRVHEIVGAYCRFADRLEVKLKRTWLAKHSVGRCLVDAILYPSDVLKIIVTYKAVFGRVPNLLRPRTFNEKLQQSKLICRRKRYVLFTDKVRVRDYVAETIGSQYLNELHWVGDDLAEARKLELPGSFVIKANNGSGTNIIVRDSEAFDWDAACRTTQGWLARDHSVWFAEWQYRWIKPQLFIESFLGDHDTDQVPPDYKFFVFHGKVEIIQVNFCHCGSKVRAFYDRDFRSLPVYKEGGYLHHVGEYPRPQALDQLIMLAEKLAGDERFVRVDLYYVGRPIFGEMTLHPWAGIGAWSPSEWDYKLGALMN